MPYNKIDEQKLTLVSEILRCLSQNNYYSLFVSTAVETLDSLYTTIWEFLFDDKSGFMRTLSLQNIKYGYSKGRFWFRFCKSGAVLEGRLYAPRIRDAISIANQVIYWEEQYA